MSACPLYPGIDCGVNTKELARIQDILLNLMIWHRHVIRTGTNQYQFACEYYEDKPDGFHRCPNNKNGICQTVLTKENFPWVLLQKITDSGGRKMWRCPCG